MSAHSRGKPVCRSDELPERGKAQRFELLLADGLPQAAFVLRVDGVLRAYLNRCAHQPAELDWTPGAFWDAEGRELVCALHGAAYEPHSGRCLGGPCGRGRLQPVDVMETGGWVYGPPHAAPAPDDDNPDTPSRPSGHAS